MLMDLMVALGMATALILMVALSVGALHRAERRLADARATNRHLEEAMLTLQNGGGLDPAVNVERLGTGPANGVWVRLTLRESTPASPVRAALVGLVPADKAGGVP
jgi:hypothetical protein